MLAAVLAPGVFGPTAAAAGLSTAEAATAGFGGVGVRLPRAPSVEPCGGVTGLARVSCGEVLTNTPLDIEEDGGETACGGDAAGGSTLSGVFKGVSGAALEGGPPVVLRDGVSNLGLLGRR